MDSLFEILRDAQQAAASDIHFEAALANGDHYLRTFDNA